ncbi:N-acetylmuramoyl-L-alanine amidase [Streptomyces shenzhenensis]|uniref:N-acetylmuramoyl-L-alanine amidase n=1 Tax=Streptomyces shenzhenensis TaxID=943815 RepID=A0A3M0IE82_9ACTN|nr:N-acetylmuramoyl-L-alanine amidase [Streptomyces shenzhenensis]RMB87377.1 N-acetylmuramoyl-L-alanine amidase [Streptomyces shenzhenensis]
MSYVGPDFEPPRPRRSRRPLTVALAALVPGALLGWLVYQAVGGSDGSAAAGGASTPPAASSASAGRSTPPTGSPDSASPDSASPRSSPGDDGKPTAAAPGATGSEPLAGKVVVIDPGHNSGNFRHTAEINRKVDIGTGRKECDTTGTATDDGYPEAQFTLDVSHRLRTLLEQQGATVKLTHDRDEPPWGPCVDERARIGNTAHADAAISIHADGSATGNRGFHVILPGSVHAGGADTRPIVAPSRDLGERIAGNFVRATGSAPANYVGGGTGLVTRADLGGLNLSTVPKVFIECGNMRDSKDAARLTSGAWRQKAAEGISEGIVSFLRG